MKKLSPEEILRIKREDETPDELLTEEERQRKARRNRKRAQRATEKVERQAAKIAEQEVAQMEAELTLPISEWQERNRGRLPQPILARLQARQEEVFDDLHWLDQNQRGNYNPRSRNYVSVWEQMAAFESDVTRFGVVDYYEKMGEVAAKYRRSELFREEVKTQGPEVVANKTATQIWLETGLLTAHPAHIGSFFETSFVERAKTSGPASPTCKCGKSVTVPSYITDVLKWLRIKFQCEDCLKKWTAEGVSSE